MAIFYTILTLAVIAAHIYSYLFVYRPRALALLVDVAFSNEKKIFWPDDVPSACHPIRLWRMFFIILSMIGIGTILYGGFLQALFWMPYEWRTPDGTWVAKYIAGILAAHSFLFLVFALGPKINTDRGIDDSKKS